MKYLLHLAWNSAWNRRMTLGLALIAIALSVAMMLGVERLRNEAQRGFSLSVSGTDLIIGAKTSPIQLVLYAVFRMGEATENIEWKQVQAVSNHPLMAWAIPISLGDSHRGFPVMATSMAYFDHFRYGDAQTLQLHQGKLFDDIFDVVLGAEVAKNLGYRIGDSVVLSHGAGANDLPIHQDKPFRVTGILAATGTPVDRTLHILLEGMTAIHLDWLGGVPLPGFAIAKEYVKKFDLTPKEVTAVLVGLKSRAAVFKVQRQLNTDSSGQLLAVMPGVALGQLWQLVGIAGQAMRAISMMVVVVGLSGLVAVILASLNERRRELAILRAVGAHPYHIFWLITLESGLVTMGGSLLGVMLLFGASGLLAPFIQLEYGIAFRPSLLSIVELKLLLILMGLGLVAGLVPGYQAYRTSLTDGLMPRL